MKKDLKVSALEKACARVETYNELARRTRSTHFQLFTGAFSRPLFNGFRRVLSRVSPKTDFLVDLIHASFGLTGEIRELRDAIQKKDFVNALEEVGDAYWYVALAHHWLPEVNKQKTRMNSPMEPISEELAVAVDQLDCTAHQLQNQVKRALFYRKSPTKGELVMLLFTLLHQLDAIVLALGAEPAHVRATNIEKLRLRYPAQYSDLAAVERNLVVEANLLVTAFSPKHEKR